MQKVEEMDLEKIYVVDLIKRESSLKKLKRMVKGAIKLCEQNKDNCKNCIGYKHRRVDHNYTLKNGTCSVGYILGEKATKYAENPEMIKAVTYVNIASLQYPEEMLERLKNLKEKLDSLQ